MIRSLAGSSYASVLTEYYDTTGHVHNDIRLGGAWTDPRAARPRRCRTNPTTTCVTFGDIQAEANRAIPQAHWTIDANTIILLLLPPGTLYEDSECGFHTSLRAGLPQGPPAVAVIHNPLLPCVRGTNPIAYAQFAAMHELAEAITDPFNGSLPGPSGWWGLGPRTAYSLSGEVADACDPAGGALGLINRGYAFVPELWSIAQNRCQPVP
jgi:hypothetical protein